MPSDPSILLRASAIQRELIGMGVTVPDLELSIALQAKVLGRRYGEIQQVLSYLGDVRTLDTLPSSELAHYSNLPDISTVSDLDSISYTPCMFSGSSLVAHDFIVIHYTTHPSFDRCVSYFSTADETLNRGKAGIHFVVGPNGEVVRMCDLDTNAQHAAGIFDRKSVNQRSIGIEMCNYGYLEYNEESGKYRSRLGGIDQSPEVDPADVVTRDFRGHLYWQRYPVEQVAAVAKIAGLVAAKYNIPTSGIIGHSQIRMEKVDPGPAFPWDSFMSAVVKTRDDALTQTQA